MASVNLGGESRRTGHSLLHTLNPFVWIGVISETRYWAYLMLLPSLILITTIVVYPVASGVWLSFHDYRLLRPDLGQPFVGIDQFVKLFQDDVFWISLRITLIWTVVGVTSQFIVGFVAALAMNRAIRGAGALRTLVLMPWFMPSVVAGYMWALMLDSRLGVINDILVRIGILDSYHPWFAQPDTALTAVLLIALWRGFPFFALLLLAGLQSIPGSLYEAADVDGASAVLKFRHITFPLLIPIIVVAVTLRVIGLVNSPDLMVILTGGGPGLATHVLSFFAFETAYAAFNFGYAAAISVIMLVILMVFTVIYLRVSGAARE